MKFEVCWTVAMMAEIQKIGAEGGVYFRLLLL
jgi:hypothetical protein